MTEIELLIDFHKNAKRQDPGSNKDTLKALSFIDLKKGQPLKIVDIGCGSGAKTILLAQNIEGRIIAVDLFPEFLDKLNANSKEHWNKEYPQIDTASNKIKILEENGFSPVGYFYLSERSWIDNYYQPMEERFDDFLKKHNNSEIAKSIVDKEKEEIGKYKKYKNFLSYGFYIAKKI